LVRWQLGGQLGAPENAFWADLTIVDKDDVIEAFIDDKVLFNIDSTDANDMVGEEGNTIFVDTK
jgi:hypothetical protein